MKITYYLILIFIFSLFSINPSFSEGTKSILLSDAGHGKLSVMPSFSSFAWYTSTGTSALESYRLHIRIKNSGEVIYFGFGETQNNNGTIVTDVNYRIKDPAGNIVVGPVLVPASGDGFISTFEQAVAGPSTVIGASGYPPLTYTPLTTGDYFIEFNFKAIGGGSHDRTKFKYFDITVASSSNEAINGRIWSKAWQFTGDANGLTYAFNGTFYIYSADSIVTSVYCNGICPYQFSLSANQWGVYNTGNFANDRRSIAGNVSLPEYKIFLNDPDPLVWPSGSLGEIIEPFGLFSDCDGSKSFYINTAKAGSMDILLKINPLPGAQSEDRLITLTVVKGINTINWDGLDGLGNPVADDLIFDVIITRINGLTNLPFYDPDDHPNGFIINTIRPTGPAPLVFWDDILISGTQDFTGCSYTLPSTGCHSILYAQGNNNTVNTWWYIKSETTISVTQMPNLSNYPLSLTQISGIGTNITLTGSIPETLFTWTCTPSSANIIGWENNAIGTTTLNQTLVNTGTNNETVTYHITPTVSGCNGQITDFVITVSPNIPLFDDAQQHFPSYGSATPGYMNGSTRRAASGVKSVIEHIASEPNR